MKREGRQQGMVRTYRISPRMVSSSPTAGVFSKAAQPGRPTSKFAGGGPRWSGCHVHPTVRGKDKSKGNNKKRSHDSAWRASYGGFSAARILDHLASQDYLDRDDEDDDVGYDDNHHLYGYGYDQHGYGGDDHEDDDDDAVGDVMGCGPNSPLGLEIRDHDSGGDGDDDDVMSFCDVGFVVDQIEGDEDWCLVEEM